MDSAARVRALRAAGDPAVWGRGAAGDAVEALLRTTGRERCFVTSQREDSIGTNLAN